MLGLGLGPIAIWIFYLAILGGAIFAACRRPEIGLYILAPLLPNETLRAKLHSLPLGDQAIDLILLGILIGLVLRGEAVLPRSRFRAPIFALWILTFLTLWSGSLLNNLPLPISITDPRFSDWKNYCRIPLILFFVQSGIKNRRQMLILIAMMCVGLLWAERGFIQSNRGRDFSTFAYSKRDAATMPDVGENGLAAFFVHNALFLLAVAVSQPKVRRWIFTSLGFLTAGCMLFVFSRGGYLAFLLGFTTLGLLKRRALVFITLAVLIISLVIGANLIPGAVIQRVTMTEDSSGHLDASAADRLIMWNLVMHMFYSDPVFGAGFDTVRFLVHYEGLGDAHNYYITLLGETGVVGLLGFLWLLWRAGLSAVELYRKASDNLLKSFGLGGITCVIAILVENLFGNRWSYIEISGYTYIMFGLIARGLDIVNGGDSEPEYAEEQDGLQAGNCENLGVAVSPAM